MMFVYIVCNRVRPQHNTPERIYEWATTYDVYKVLSRVLAETTENVLSSIGVDGLIQWFSGVFDNIGTLPDEEQIGYKSCIQIAIIRFQEYIPRTLWEPWWNKNFKEAKEKVSLLNVNRGLRNVSMPILLDDKFLFAVLFNPNVNKNIFNQVINACKSCILYQSEPPPSEIPDQFNYHLLKHLSPNGKPTESKELLKHLQDWVSVVAVPELVKAADTPYEMRKVFLNTSHISTIRTKEGKQAVADYVSSVIIGCAQSENPVQKSMLATAVLAFERHQGPLWTSLYHEWKDNFGVIVDEIYKLSAAEKVFLTTALNSLDSVQDIPENTVASAYEQYLVLGADS